jgi:hypothetical protein
MNTTHETSHDDRPPVATARVIAAGCTSDGRLRATVMLTPSYSQDDRARLGKWPSSIIRWLRAPEREWKFTLSVDWIQHTESAEGCIPSKPGVNRKNVKGIATGAKWAWESVGEPKWLDELWQRVFISCHVPDVWSTLHKLIECSSSGNAYSATKSGMAGDGEPGAGIDPSKKVISKPERSKNSETVDVDVIYPASQSDLALMLEIKRAMELCNTIRLALGEKQKFAETEADSVTTAQAVNKDGTRKDLDLTPLLKSARDQYKAATESVKAVYRSSPCPKPISNTTGAVANVQDLARGDAKKIERQLHGPLDSHEAAHQRQSRIERGDPEIKDDKEKAAQSGKAKSYGQDDFLRQEEADAYSAVAQRFFNIQGSPALARLFGLAFDVLIDASDLPDHLKDSEGFMYLAVQEDSLRNGKGVDLYTLAKYRSDNPRAHFMPVSRAEMQFAGTQAKCLLFLSQYEGVLVAGQSLKSETGEIGRLELSSLDVRVATEAAIDRRASNHTADDVENQLKSANLAARPTPIARKTHITGGITLLDRARQQQAVAQFAARLAHHDQMKSASEHDTPFVILDSEDLTVGYRIDVAVPIRDPKRQYEWRTLMARELRHGLTGQYGPRAEQAIFRLFGSDAGAAEWRQCVEDGILALPARLIEQESAFNAHVEEALTTWNGEPMGAQTTGSRDEKVLQHSALPIGCVIALPTGEWGAQRRPPALRFEWPYRFGVRPVFPGGSSISLLEASRLYDKAGSHEFPIGGALTVPSTWAADCRKRSQLRRYLRHERIDAPFLLLPETVAMHRNGPMGYERAAHAIVRTVFEARNRERETPRATQRVFVVPCVSKHFAGMHRVFDRHEVKHPEEGLAGVRFDAEGGGFPVVLSDTIVGLNGTEFDKDRRISRARGDRQQGDLVYTTSAELKREVPYYPDPAAEFYVVGVRYPGTNKYLDGSCLIPIYLSSWEREYPNARPLSFIVQRHAAPGGRPRSVDLKHVLAFSGQKGHRPVSGSVPGTVAVHGAVEAVLTLAPGDDFEVDVWCIPSSERMACLLAVIETVGALILSQEGDDGKPTSETHEPSGSDRPLRDRLSASLLKLFPQKVCDDILSALQERNFFDGQPTDWRDGYSGVGGLATPGPKALTAIARAIHATLATKPLDEISAVRTLRVTHAIDKPRFEPVMSVPAGARRTPGLPSRLLEIQRTSTTVAKGGTPSHDFVINGDLVVHLPTSAGIEICAKTVSPNSDNIDDVRRSRSLREKRLAKAVTRATTAEKCDEVYGFCVDADGNVMLPRREVVLYRLEGIPALLESEDQKTDSQCSDPPNKEGRVTLALEKMFETDGKCFFGTPKRPFRFTDGLARELILRTRVIARNVEQMRTANSPAVDGKWLRPGSDLSAEESSVYGAPVHVWLLAADRPAEPHALSPVPAFVWRKELIKHTHRTLIKRVTRYTIVRIPLARPWFSSGEDERLGIVVWPPDLPSQNVQDLEQDQVQVPVSDGSTPRTRAMNLRKFVDEDLGPGGKYVTRWGGDPTRVPSLGRRYIPGQFEDEDAPYSMALEDIDYNRTFVPYSAFLDVSPETRLGFVAEYVPKVLMPVRLEASDSQPVADGSGQPPLKVGLITYQPRFDVETEQWYVNAAIQHPSEAEPFLRLGLVRYQPHAHESLQLSYPTTQWIQLLPRRSVEVSARREARKLHVDVQIDGLAVSSGKAATSDLGELDPVQKMSVRIVREHRSDLGALCRRVVGDLSDGPEVRNPETVEGFKASWRRKLEVDLDEGLDKSECASYCAYVDEREAHLPATYTNEPVTVEAAKGTADTMVDTGARFLASINIDLPHP